MNLLRVATRYDPTGRRDTRHCQQAGCKRATTGRKPYCTEHVALMPQVQRLQEELQRREDEWSAVLRRGARAVDPQGTTAQEILMYLKIQGSSTVRRLAKDLSMDLELLTPYVNALRRHRLVRVTQNKRGIPLVHYTGPEEGGNGAETAAAKKTRAA